MKHKSIRIALLGLLAAASLSAYIFLSIAAMSQGERQLKPAAKFGAEEYEDHREREEASVFLMDLYFLKKVFQAAKQLIPAT
jgi:D-arabinose 1-dehydrogenase-like Zn-dependent alcohol dehydrogenase